MTVFTLKNGQKVVTASVKTFNTHDVCTQLSIADYKAALTTKKEVKISDATASRIIDLVSAETGLNYADVGECVCRALRNGCIY